MEFRTGTDTETERPIMPWEAKSLPLGFDLIDDAVPEEICAQVIDWINEKAKFERSKIGRAGGTVADYRTSETINFPFIHFNLPDFAIKMNKTVWDAVNDYARTVGFPLYDVEHPSVQRYEIGQKYDLHWDYADDNNRVLSALVYLNDVEEGGETEFPLQSFKITPKVGRLAVFPANFMWKHRALPPRSGVKYAAAYWCRG